MALGSSAQQSVRGDTGSLHGLYMPNLLTFGRHAQLQPCIHSLGHQSGEKKTVRFLSFVLRPGRYFRQHHHTLPSSELPPPLSDFSSFFIQGSRTRTPAARTGSQQTMDARNPLQQSPGECRTVPSICVCSREGCYEHLKEGSPLHRRRGCRSMVPAMDISLQHYIS